MNQTTLGSTLADCFSLVSRCGAELDGFNTALSNILMSELSNNRDLPCVLSGECTESYATDDSGWVCIGYQKSFPLKPRGKGRKSTSRYLSFQVSMTGKYIGYDQQNSEPLVHINLWGIPIDFENEDQFMTLTLREGDSYKIYKEKIFLWDSDDEEQWLRSYWTFSVKLSKLNSIGDLKINIVNPVLDLLKGNDFDCALPDNLPALFFYGNFVEEASEADPEQAVEIA